MTAADLSSRLEECVSASSVSVCWYIGSFGKGGLCEPNTLPLICPCGVHKIATKRLKHVDDGIAAVFDTISNPLGDDAVCLLQQYEEQLTEFKSEHSSVHTSLLSYDIEDTSDLSRLLVRVKKGVFDCSLQIKKLFLLFCC